jgi:hypothetical protein
MLQPWIMRLPTLTGLAVTALAACGGAGAGSPPQLGSVVPGSGDPELAPPGLGLRPGEAMTFAVSVGGIEAGAAAFAVGDAGTIDGRDALVVSSRVASTGVFRAIKEVQDDLTTTIDVDTGLPIALTADVVFGDKRYHADGRFRGGVVELAWHRGDGHTRNSRYDFGSIVAHDAHTAMAAMRTWEASPGAQRRLYIVGGRRIWRTDVVWVGREPIGTALGNHGAVRLDGHSQRVTRRLEVEGSAAPREFSVWMSDDADRVPLKVIAYTELGEVEIVLVDYVAGR